MKFVSSNLHFTSVIIFGSIMPITADETTAAPITPLPSTASVPVSAPTSTCTGSTPGWVNVYGNGCDWYEQNDLPGCPYFGAYVGIDDSTGELIIGEPGSVGNGNCCYCFGTAAPSHYPTYSPTISQYPTTETKAPVTPYPTYILTFPRFSTFSPTTSLSPTTETRAPVTPPTHYPTYSPTTSQSPTAPTPKPTSPCTGNTPNWTDSFGDGCEFYEQYDAPGCPDLGMYYVGDMGPAKDNCCYCKMG